MRVLRNITFYTFAAAYLLCCPLAILYGLGYWIAPGDPQGVIKTGLIYLSSAPPGASILVGKRRYANRTPTVIRHLPIGTYQVELLLKGYQPWSRTIPIEPGKASVLERILLLPTSWQPAPVIAEPFERLIPLPGTRLFLLLRGPTLRHASLFDTHDELERALLERDSPLSGSRFVSLLHVPESPACVIKAVDAGGREQWLHVEVSGAAPRLVDLTPQLPEGHVSLQWDPKHAGTVFVLSRPNLWRIDTTHQSARLRIAGDVRGFGISGRRLSLLQEDARLIETDEEGRLKRVLLNDPGLGQAIFGPGGGYRILPVSDELLLFLGERGELLGNRLPHRFVEEGVAGVSVEGGAQRLLLWKKDRIGILNFRKPSGIEGIFEKPPAPEWMFTRGRRIEQVFWVYERSHVLFRDGHEVWLLEADTYGRPRLAPILAVKPGTSIAYVEETGRLYFLDPSSSHLMTLELLPRTSLLLLPFPDRREEPAPTLIQEP